MREIDTGENNRRETQRRPKEARATIRKFSKVSCLPILQYTKARAPGFEKFFKNYFCSAVGEKASSNWSKFSKVSSLPNLTHEIV